MDPCPNTMTEHAAALSKALGMNDIHDSECVLCRLRENTTLWAESQLEQGTEKPEHDLKEPVSLGVHTDSQKTKGDSGTLGFLKSEHNIIQQAYLRLLQYRKILRRQKPAGATMG